MTVRFFGTVYRFQEVGITPREEHDDDERWTLLRTDAHL